MIKNHGFGLVLALASSLVALPSNAQEGGRPLTAALTGEAEKPGPGDPDGSGSATLTVNVGQAQVCYDLVVGGIDQATMAHIHKAPADASGPAVVPLTAPDATGKSSGCASADKALVKDILQNPEAYYVNVHNAAFKAGAVRGQLQK